MKNYRWILMLIVLLSSCVTTRYPQLKPIEPSLGYLLYPAKVNSLSPKFKWEPSKESGVTYDFAIYETLGYTYRNVWSQGKQVYYKEGLENPVHEIEIKLLPKKVYLWSVRVRNKDKVLEWSYLNFNSNASLQTGNLLKGYNTLFSIKTPKIH